MGESNTIVTPIHGIDTYSSIALTHRYDISQNV